MNLSRQCINVKNRKQSNVRCSNRATNEDFCSKHYKNPIMFVYPEYQQKAVVIIQKIWKKYCSKQFFSRQGPARNDYSIANNDSDIYSLEPLVLVPKTYFFSFYDSNKHVWAFDIRTLSYMCSRSKNIKNPYTQEVLTKDILKKIDKRLSWLKKFKYSITYDSVSLTNEQMWNQRVLDVFNKIEELGYLVNSDWFHDMDKEDHIIFYKKIYDIWNYRLQLTIKEKSLIVPGFNKKNKLFKFLIEELNSKEEKVLRKNTLQIIESFISSEDKTQKALGIMYVLMGLSYVNDSVSEAYSWIQSTLY